MKESKKSIQIFYMGNPIHSPFDHRELSREIIEEGIVHPQAVPRSLFKRLPGSKLKTHKAESMDEQQEKSFDCFDFAQVECG
jgi:hypothetical protein